MRCGLLLGSAEFYLLEKRCYHLLFRPKFCILALATIVSIFVLCHPVAVAAFWACFGCAVAVFVEC